MLSFLFSKDGIEFNHLEGEVGSLESVGKMLHLTSDQI